MKLGLNLQNTARVSVLLEKRFYREYANTLSTILEVDIRDFDAKKR